MNNEKNKTSGKSKRAALIFVIAALIIGIVSGVLLFVLERIEKSNEDMPTNMYSDELNSYIFYKPDYDLDVTTVEEYMELDRLLYYKDGAEEYGIDTNAGDYGKAAQFFREYFDTAIAGDHEAYNEMFTEHYYDSNESKNEFAPQMIYDMHVSKLWEKVEDGGTERYAFDVSYRIYRNDGTFRNDIDSGAAKTLYFELVYSDGEMKIDRITYYV